MKIRKPAHNTNMSAIFRYTNIKKKCVSTFFFSNDLMIQADILLDYYSLRFQIEFDFRDAKQHFGLSDFKL
jgi:putative transposase